MLPEQPSGRAETANLGFETLSVPETRAAVFVWACRLMETEGGSA
jgi:hypothetical protein